MHESERNRLENLHRALLLAASDMVQAEAAARALEAEHGNLALMRALETGIGVCYARAFTQSPLKSLTPVYIPTAPEGAQLHAYLRDLRDKVYAHTDKESGRTSSIDAPVVVDDAEMVVLEWHEEWNAFPRGLLEPAVALFDRQRDRFLNEAMEIRQQLDASEPS